MWIHFWWRKVRFSGGKGPQKKLEKRKNSESEGPHCYGPCSHVPTGLPRGEITERSEDQVEGKGPHLYGPCSPSPVCPYRGRSVAEGTPLSAPISLLIARNYTITVCFLILWSVDYYIRSIWWLTVNYVTNCGRIGKER